MIYFDMIISHGCRFVKRSGSPFLRRFAVELLVVRRFFSVRKFAAALCHYGISGGDTIEDFGVAAKACAYSNFQLETLLAVHQRDIILVPEDLTAESGTASTFFRSEVTNTVAQPAETAIAESVSTCSIALLSSWKTVRLAALPEASDGAASGA